MKRNALTADLHNTILPPEDAKKSKTGGTTPTSALLLHNHIAERSSLVTDTEDQSIWSLTDTELVMNSIDEFTKPLHSFVFLHQIYFNLSLNKSLVDKDIELLQKRRDIKRMYYRDIVRSNRTFTQDSYENIVLMATKKYLLDIDKHFSKVSATNNPIAMLALTTFREWISKTNFVTITHNQLMHPDSLSESMVMIPAFGNDEIVFLSSAGYLRATNDGTTMCTSYYLSHPKLGRVLNFMQWIEKAVVSKLSKLKFHEIRESKLVVYLIQESSNYMKQNNFGREANTKGSMLFSHELWRYHRLDLLGRKVLISFPTPDEQDTLLRLG
jgi:hypothetical protein